MGDEIGHKESDLPGLEPATRGSQAHDSTDVASRAGRLAEKENLNVTWNCDAFVSRISNMFIDRKYVKETLGN